MHIPSCQSQKVEYILGKVFFTTCSDLNMLKKLKSAERLFLLIKKQFPFNVPSEKYLVKCKDL